MPKWSAGAFVRACEGESVCGDVAVILPIRTGMLLAVVDGLGHGPRARAASAGAEEWLRGHAEADVAALADGLCEWLRNTDGAAVGLCRVDDATGVAHYAGIGNTVLRTFGRRHEGRLVPRDGIAGQTNVRAKAYAKQLDPGDLLLLYSDGVPSRFRIEECPWLLAEDPAAAARTVITHFGKPYDDAACVAARWWNGHSQTTDS